MTAEPLTMDEARARMLANVRAAGGRTVEDEAPEWDGLRPSSSGETGPGTEAGFRRLRLDLDEDDAGEVELVIDGELHVLRVPPLTPHAGNLVSGYGARLQSLQAEMATTADPRAMRDLATRMARVQVLYLQALIPDYTPELHQRMRARHLRQLEAFCEQIMTRAELPGDTRPNPRAG